NRICFLVARNPGEIPRGASLTGQALPPEVPSGLPSTLLERRPDILGAEQQLVSASAEVGAAMAEFFPKVSLTGAFGGVSPDVSDLFAAGKAWSIAAGLAGPLFQGGRLKNQYDANVALFEQGKAQYEAAVTRAFGEVSTALSAYRELATSERDQALSVAAYQDAVRLANVRYVAGLPRSLEVPAPHHPPLPPDNPPLPPP